MIFARRSVVVSATATCLALALGGCGSSDEQLVVYAASSLTDAFERIETEFEAEHGDVDVVISFGGSSSLAAQLVDGAPGQVFATANPEQMQRVVDERQRPLAPAVFAENSMVVAVEAGNPLGIDGVAALADGPVVVLAAPEVPAGDYAARVLACAGVEVDVASFEPSVRSVATKVALGEADAGIVYRTDVDDRLDAIEIDPSCDERAEYPIVALTDDEHAGRFVEFVRGQRGRAALVAAGFEVP